jgi:hypothetical protein
MDDESLSERVDELEDLVNINDDKSESVADSHAGWLIANEALIFALLNQIASLSDDKKAMLGNIWSYARAYTLKRPIYPDLDPDNADLYRRLAAGRIDILIVRLAAQWGHFEHEV